MTHKTTEARARDIARRYRVQDAILMTLYAGAAFSLAIALPNTVQMLSGIDPDFAKKRHPSRRMSQAISRLKSRGFLIKNSEGKLCLTAKGEAFALKLESHRKLRIKTPKRWDGRWRIVIFDVWERRRHVRDRLRMLLMKIGFVKVQNSVWVFPYDCEEVLAFIKIDLRIGKGMLYVIAEGLEGDVWLKKHFKLPESL